MFSVLFQVFVGFEVVRVEDAALLGCSFDVSEQGFRGHVWDDVCVNASVALQDAQYGLFVESAPSSFSLSLAAEVRLVYFH